jgi:hypothetical protein
MPTPDDALDVIRALRLGWYIAEVRGRNWPAGPQPPGDELPRGGNHSLPLRTERTAAELRAEAQAVLGKLSGELQVDTVRVNNQEQSGTAVIEQQARVLAAAEPETKAAAAAWNALSASIYELDAHAQDTLAAQSDMRAAAYLLGRGLAEAYWALDPGAACVPPAPQCWALLKDWRAGFHTLRALWVQIVTAVISIGLVIALITLILGGSANAALKAIFGVVGVVGLSAASIQTGIKSSTQGLLSRLRQDAYTDLVASAVAEAPGKPGARNPRAALIAEVRKRTLTTVADASVPG